jgi:monoamine oxidase
MTLGRDEPALSPTFRPRLAPVPSEVDVAIVGAGAAGIGAARRCLAEGLTCAVLEARDRVGGRCVTAELAGRPVDLGAHWLHAGAQNPLVALGRERGEPLSRAHQSGRLIVSGVLAEERTAREHREAFERAGAAIANANAMAHDPSIADVLPDLGRWRLPIAATFALISGRPLDEVSAQDFPSDEFGDNWFVRGGYGAYLARLAEGLPLALAHPVEDIDCSGKDVVVSGGWGRLEARAVIVTVPVPVLVEGAIRFTPRLPDRIRDTLAAFLPGTYEHIVLDWPDSPFYDADRLAKIMDDTTSFGLMSRLDGSPIHYLEIDHATAEAHGRNPARLAAFARDWLAWQLGGDAVRRLTVPYVTNWFEDPWSRGAWAVARPGRASDRPALAEPLGERLWLVGEATSRRMWGTVGGAWEEGEAAVAALAATLMPAPRGAAVQNPA